MFGTIGANGLFDRMQRRRLMDALRTEPGSARHGGSIRAESGGEAFERGFPLLSLILGLKS